MWSKPKTLSKRPASSRFFLGLLCSNSTTPSVLRVSHFAVMERNGDVEASKQVQVRFVTKLKPPMQVPPTSIAIPSHLTRLGLSAVVNNLIKAGNPDWETHPFDFLIKGEFIRMSLENFLIAKDITAEKILDIEYIKAIAPIKQDDPFPHDDWVSAVSGADPRFIVTGSYDGLGRIWRADGSCTHILDGHGVENGAITSVSVFNPKGFEGDANSHIATASQDHTLRLWKFHTEERLNRPVNIRSYGILKGHTASVQSVAAHASGEMMCSGSWDRTISLWRINEPYVESDSASLKKRKVDKNARESLLEVEPVSSLVGHTDSVSSVVWPNDNIYSASWDHSIRRWDITTGQEDMNLSCGKVVYCVDVGGEGSKLVAAGGSDPVLRIWDPRKPGTSAPIYQLFSSHTSFISAFKWHARSFFHLLSASYDGKVMLWDLRTAWPVSVIDSHMDKVLCADWWKGNTVISGGADSKLCISSEMPIP